MEIARLLWRESELSHDFIWRLKLLGGCEHLALAHIPDTSWMCKFKSICSIITISLCSDYRIQTLHSPSSLPLTFHSLERPEPWNTINSMILIPIKHFLSGIASLGLASSIDFGAPGLLIVVRTAMSLWLLKKPVTRASTSLRRKDYR